VSNPRPCERCGQPLSGAASDNICPRCLAQLGQATWLGESETEAPGTGPDLPPQQSDTRQRSPSEALRIRYFGDYELLEEIARGGMGTVYRVRQVSLNRPVALKLISAGALATPELVKRFQAEAELAASLTHPNIVPIHEIGQHDGQHYFSMGLVNGPSLRKHLNGHPMPTREAAALMATVARAVHYAHQRGVLHRDLKPSNIVLDRDGTPHLTDFGLAKLVEGQSTLTHTDAVLGTPSYMAPEQARGATKEVTTAADVYGLGAVLYETLTGHPPFAGGTSVETIRQVLDQEPRRPSLWNRAVDRDLETICLKCLEKEPEQRYTSADAVAEDLERWGDHNPILARRISAWEHTRKWLRRRPPVFFAMASAVAISFIGGLTGILWQWNEAVMARDQALEERQRAEQHAQDASDREKAVNRYLYAAQMNLVQRAWEQNDLRQLRSLLMDTAAYPARGFEWYYWQGRTRWQSLTLQADGHVRRVVAFSPTGSQIVTSGSDGVRVWNSSTGEEISRFEGYRLGIGPMPFSPDGNLLVGHWDGATKVWEAHTGRILHAWEGPNAWLCSLGFSGDGKRVILVTGISRPSVTGWNVSDGQEIFRFSVPHGASVVSGAVSHDGERIVTGCANSTLIVWDTSSGEPIFTFNAQCGSIRSVAFSPDGERIVTGHSLMPIAIVWDASTGAELFTIPADSGLLWLVGFSPDGGRIVTVGHYGIVKIWDAFSGEKISLIKGQSGRIGSAAFSPDGQSIVASSADGDVKVWQTEGRQRFIRIGGSDRQRVATAYSPQRGRLRLQFPPFRSVEFSPDGQRIASVGSHFGEASRVAKVWDASSGEELLTLDGHTREIRAIAFCPTSQTIATGSADQTAKIWDASSGDELRGLDGHAGGITAIAFSPTGETIATGSADHTAKIWHAYSGQELHTLEGHTSAILLLAFSPDGRHIITCSQDRTVRIWDVTTGQEVLVFDSNNGSIESVAVSPDGRWVLTGGSDWRARVWDMQTGREMFTLDGHTAPISTVAYSPDGQRIVTGSSDGSAKVWDPTGGQQLLTLDGHRSGLRAVSFSPDGRGILTADGEGTIRHWQAASPEQVAAWLTEEEAAEEATREVRASASDAEQNH
jgi:eukaryotic-like serine/threonine-protein kinase